MKNLLFTLLLSVCLVVTVSAQNAYDATGSPWFLQAAIPATSTTAVSHTVKITQINLSNTTSSAVTVTITDNGTDCNGGPCQIVPAVSIDGNTKYVINLNGEVASNGIIWAASTANAVHAFIRGN